MAAMGGTSVWRYGVDGLYLMRPIPAFGSSTDELKDPVTYPSTNNMPLFVYKASALSVGEPQHPPPSIPILVSPRVPSPQPPPSSHHHPPRQMEQLLPIHDTVTAFSQPDAIKAAQADIDCEIQRLSNWICSLKSRRNSLCTVSRLPPEVLSEVFLDLAEQLQAQDRFKVDFKWTSVAHVCHLWRHVALQHGRLWGKIDMTRPDRTSAFVDRSKGAPLAVRQSFPGSLADLPTAFADPSYRYRELHLRAKEGQLGPNVLRILSSPIHAPVLESLVLEVSDSFVEFTLPPTVFDHKAPALTRLQLQNVRLEWSASLFPSLTHLSIQ